MNESWNPEPPPEIVKIQKEDLIGNTLFSKHWLFEFLLKLIKIVEDESEKKLEEEINTTDVTNGYFKEIDPDFEKDLCDLWDMTVEKDVCIVLDEFNAIQIFEGYIRKFDEIYPRAIEILIGVLVNMASMSQEICFKIQNGRCSDHNPSDSIIRCIFDQFGKKENKNFSIKQKFIDYLKNELEDDSENEHMDDVNLNWKGIIEKFYFILEQSLNPDLLDNISSFLLNLLDSDDQILNAFSSDSRIVDAICNAASTRFNLDHKKKNFNSAQFTTTTRRGTNETSLKNSTTPINPRFTDTNESKQVILSTQLSQEDISTIDSLFNKYFLCLQTLSTCESGALALFSRAECLIQLFDDYLAKCLSTFNDWEIKSAHSLKASVVPESLQNFICLISVLNCLFPDQESKNLIEIDKCFPNFFHKLFTVCKYFLSLFNEIRETNPAVESSGLEANFNMAKSILKDLFENVRVLKQNSNFANLILSCEMFL